MDRDSIIGKLEDGYVPDPNSGCWIWFKACGGGGYGELVINGVMHWAHRLSYETFVGPIPAGCVVRHKCDTKCCINPDHLVVGSGRDNCADMARRNRGRRGAGKFPYGVRPNHKRFLVQVGGLYWGTFDTVEEAADVAIAAKRELYG